MSTREFAVSVTIILATMALIAVVELIQPMSTRTARHRGRSTANLGLTVLTLVLNWALTSAAAILALAIPLRAPGLLARLGIPLAVQIVASVAVLDFCFGYLAHRAMHTSPLLWRIHRVHHSDPFVDASTTYRTHPLEVVWRFLFLILPVWILGVPAAAVVMYRLLSALNGILEHANVRLWQPLDSAVSLIWVTPNMHKVHHSRKCDETDSNYGNLLAIPDRLLRTFTPTSRAFSVTYGLDDVDPLRATSLARLLVAPFQSDPPTCDPDSEARRADMATSPSRSRTVYSTAFLCALMLSARPATGTGLDTAKIVQLTGVNGTLDASEGVFKVSVPRSDPVVTVAGVTMVPPMGLTSWAAFAPAGDRTMIMGDLVLQEDQVVPVMDAALNNGLEVTALHNHFLSDSPKVMFMHIGGTGDQELLATAVGKVFATIQQTNGGKGRLPTATINAAGSTVDAAVIDSILGAKGTTTGGVYKAVVGRTTKMHGYDVGAAMGVNTWFAFAGSDQQAVVDGDFAMYEPELQPVLKALRKADIAVVAIHNHMTMEEPRVLFLHFWGIGPLRNLATGVRSALDVQGGK